MEVLLVRSEINPNTVALGAWNEWYEGVMEILHGRSDVNPNELIGDGKTPLWRAAPAGHEGVVKILLGRVLLGRGGVDPTR